ncbi:hypothetical protein [Sedimentitalea arenosa]|jgi:hypothetical protein|uniref:Uncharacterized protein n=1 Tax=Sedimentitalea arenosa TaxID=2798803 RepID=A0A8J7JIM2_9RHOB|nr:hypothetical protein [Arenibacterium arenosum]MBJ6372769.1 hypothetical protein [Arenibacterium arenosum]
MGVITAFLASGPVRKALGLLLAAQTIALFLLNLRRAGERAGRLVERLQTSEKTHDVQRQMLDAASRRPADRDALVERLRDGRF